MKAQHPYILRYPIDLKAKNLILGTHPTMPLENPEIEFFYGNMCELWRYMSLVYSNDALYLNNRPNLELIQKFLARYEMTVTDVVFETDGNKFSTDEEMVIVSFNPFLKDWLAESAIEHIYFTSYSGKQSAHKLFRKWYREAYGKPIKMNGDKYIVGDKLLGITDLYSPSPAANIGISGSPTYKAWKGSNPSGDLDKFRIQYYERHLPPKKSA